MQWSPQEQDQVKGSNLQGTRPKPGTSVGTGLSQVHLQEQAWASNFSWRRPEPVTSTGAGPRQLPTQEQVQGNDHQGSSP